MGNDIKHLLKPITINTLELKNRIVMPPMDCNYAGLNGEVTKKMIDHYEVRAKHGVGLIVVEATSVVPNVKNLALQPIISDDWYVAGFGNLVEAIHSWGSKTLLQIQHSGNEAGYGELVSASNVPSRAVGGYPKPLSIAQIEDLIERFIQAAKRAQAAGFDGIELHGAHGYLVNQFLSPFYNRRTDEFGGSIENRARFAVRIIETVKELLGKDFNVCVRYSADECIEGGLTVAESQEFAKLFQAAGADLLHVSAGVYDSPMFTIAPSAMPQGMLVPIAKAIKDVVEIPVIAVGRIVDPLVAERILAEGSADLVAFGRALLADPSMPSKVYENRLDEIRKCISCRYCIDRSPEGLDVKCAINPSLGREGTFGNKHGVRERKKVAVIGGGPAGMQAAINAKRLGHDVTLLERESQLGGQLKIAAIPYGKDIRYLLEYLTTTVKKLGIEVQLQVEADVPTLKELNPDVVIVATGGREKAPTNFKFNPKSVMYSWEALLSPEKAGKRVVVIGGGSTGCETAELLAGHSVDLEFIGMKWQGPDYRYTAHPVDNPFSYREVSVVEMLEEVASDMEPISRELLLLRLRENRIKIFCKAFVLGIEGNTLTYFDLDSQKRASLEADTFVLAVGVESSKDLLDKLGETDLRVLSVGDCVKPGKIPEAILQGALAAERI